MYFFYNAALVLAFVLATPYWLFKMLRHGKYRAGLAERLGRVPERVRSAQPGDVCVWIHAVSVGEVLAISQLVNELRNAVGEKLRVVVSTTTTTGQSLARERFGEENVFYFPLDLGFCIGPYMRALRPKLVVMAETEFWPNFLRKAKRCGAQVAVVNARISDRSLPGYRRWKGVLSRVLVNVDRFLAQSEEDKRRLIEIGADPKRVEVSGNLKFDVKPPGKLGIVEQLRGMLARSGVKRLLVCGSTMDGEEALLLDAFTKALPLEPSQSAMAWDVGKLAIFLAPRKPERFDEVARLVEAKGMRLLRRSTLRGNEDLAGAVLLLDSIGELPSIYQLGRYAFVGGSVTPRGGHNILEPAQFGVPIIVGPHTNNFRDIVAIFDRQKVLTRVDESNFQETIVAILHPHHDPGGVSWNDLSTRTSEVFLAQSGATARTAAALNKLLEVAQ